MSMATRNGRASPRSSTRPAPSATFARCRTRSRRAPGPPAPWRATPSKWRTSATGPTPPSRPMSARSAALALHAAEGRAASRRPSGSRFPARAGRRARRRRSPGPVALGGEIGRLPAHWPRRSRRGGARMRSKPGTSFDAWRRSWLVCQVDLRRGHGRAELDRYRALAELTGAGDHSRDHHPRHASIRSPSSARSRPRRRRPGLAPAAVSVFPAQDMKSGPTRRPWPACRASRRPTPRRAGLSRARGSAAAWPPTSPSSTASARPPALLDYVTHTTCPIVHAADDRSVMETIEAAALPDPLDPRLHGRRSPTASARARSAAARTPTASPRRRIRTTAAFA